jgi:hypothetical protein
MLNDLNQTLRREVASRWPELAHFARRQGELSSDRGETGCGFLLLPDPDGKSEYIDHILDRPDSRHFVNAYSTRSGPRVGKGSGAHEHGVVWFDALWKPDEGEADLGGAETVTEEFESILQASEEERAAFVDAHGMLEWAARCTPPIDGSVIIALQVGSSVVWENFHQVDGTYLLDAADSYEGPTDPGTQLGDENLLMN